MTSKAKRNVVSSHAEPTTHISDISFIILAANMGYRMKTKGPKALFDLGSETILDHQITTILRLYPDSDIVVVANFQHDKIRKHIYGKRYPVRLVINPHEEEGVLRGIGIGLQATISKEVCVLCGDLVLGSTVLGGFTSSSVLIGCDEKNNEEVGLVVDENNTVTNLAYGLPQKWGQVAYFAEKETAMLKKISLNHNRFGHLMFHETLNKIIGSGGRFTVKIVDITDIVDIDSSKELAKVRETYE